jgi:hypothetical protein
MPLWTIYEPWGCGPLKVSSDQLPGMLGATSVSVVGPGRTLALADTNLGVRSADTS